MSSSLHVGLVQYDVAWEDPAVNFDRLDTMLKDESNLDLVVLPEMWSTGFTMHTEHAAEPVLGPASEWMKQHANQYNTHVAGSVSVKNGVACYNRFYCFEPSGHHHQYDKKHLFSYGKEEQHYTAGKNRITFQIGEWKIMPIICYDLRFPAWCRNTDDYDVMLVVANWPQARIHHWDALLRARAIENQCYVVAVNRVGTDGNNLVYNGHSAVYDMNGNTLLDLESKEGIGKTELRKDDLDQFRNQYRFLQDRDRFYW